MSTSPERAETAVVNLLSRWLAGHVGNEQVRAGLASVDPGDLGPESAELLGELLTELRGPVAGGELERLVRETIEAVALGA